MRKQQQLHTLHIHTYITYVDDSTALTIFIFYKGRNIATTIAKNIYNWTLNNKKKCEILKLE